MYLQLNDLSFIVLFVFALKFKHIAFTKHVSLNLI